MCDEYQNIISAVAPLAGAWIEIRCRRTATASSKPSRPSRARGLKLEDVRTESAEYIVAPLAGAWIEICSVSTRAHIASVAPLAGAWIEIQTIFASLRQK